MVELLKEEMNCLRPLSKGKIDVAISSCIEGKMGRAWVNRKNEPTAAIVVVADFCFLLGCITNEEIELVIDELIEKCKRKIVVTDDALWVSIIERCFPNNLSRMKRYSMKNDFDAFQKNIFYQYIEAVESEFLIERIDESIYFKVLEDKFMADCCSNFSSLDEFLNHGIGYVIMHNGEIISAASSYSYCEGNIDITIGTKEEYRRKGLALAVASKLILDCIERNIYPRWEAANLHSVALAEKLGYQLDKEIEVFFIS